MGKLADVLATCLGVRKRETVLIVTDDQRFDVARALEKAARELSGEVLLMSMAPRGHHAEEPPKAVADAMRSADVVILPTTMSLTHTDARKQACENGARIASMPGITMEMLTKGGMTADYGQVKEVSEDLADRMSKGMKIEIRTEAGSDLFAGIADRKALADSGIFIEKGQSGNLPGGEAFIAPVEGLSHGTLVIDGSMGGMGKVKDGLTISVDGGQVTNVEGDGGRLTELLDRHENGRNVAEIGIGTNPMAKIIGNVLEDEKVMGTCHVAFGDNHTFGGETRADIHLDGIIKRPDILIDGETIMKKGRLV